MGFENKKAVRSKQQTVKILKLETDNWARTANWKLATVSLFLPAQKCKDEYC